MQMFTKEKEIVKNFESSCKSLQDSRDEIADISNELHSAELLLERTKKRISILKKKRFNAIVKAERAKEVRASLLYFYADAKSKVSKVSKIADNIKKMQKKINLITEWNGLS